MHQRKGSERMATELKRFTISVTDEMNVRLDRLKQARYYNVTRNRMIQDLINMGLDVMQKKMEKEKKEGGENFL